MALPPDSHPQLINPDHQLLGVGSHGVAAGQSKQPCPLGVALQSAREQAASLTPVATLPLTIRTGLQAREDWTHCRSSPWHQAMIILCFSWKHLYLHSTALHPEPAAERAGRVSGPEAKGGHLLNCPGGWHLGRGCLPRGGSSMAFSGFPIAGPEQPLSDSRTSHLDAKRG